MKNAIEILENSEKIVSDKLAEVEAALKTLMQQQAVLTTQLSDITEALKQLKGSDEPE